MHLEHNATKPLDPDKAPQSPFRTPAKEGNRWWPFTGPPPSKLPPLPDEIPDENTVKTPPNDV